MSLCETLDRVLNKGAVIAGDLVISVADVDLLCIGLSLVVSSVETMRTWAGDGRRVGGDTLLDRVGTMASIREEPAARTTMEV